MTTQSTELSLTSAIEQIKALPQLQTAREETVAKAKAGVESIATRLETAEGTQENVELVKARLARLKEISKQFNADRAPATQALDSIKKPFVAHEKAIDDLVPKLQKLLDRWATENHEKDKKDQAEREKVQNKALEAVRVKALWEQTCKEFPGRVVSSRSEQIAKLFATLTLDNDATVVAEIKKMKLPLNPEQVHLPYPPAVHHTLEEVMAICPQPTLVEVNTAFLTALSPIVDKYLTELLPGKLQALQQGVSAVRIAEAEFAQAETIRKAQQEEADRIALEAKSQEQSGTFEVIAQAAEATVVVDKIVKAKVKLKFVPESNLGVLAAIGYWLNGCGETLPELEARFKMQIGYCNKALNSDLITEIGGCKVVEEVRGK